MVRRGDCLSLFGSSGRPDLLHSLTLRTVLLPSLQEETEFAVELREGHGDAQQLLKLESLQNDSWFSRVVSFLVDILAENALVVKDHFWSGCRLRGRV